MQLFVQLFERFFIQSPQRIQYITSNQKPKADRSVFYKQLCIAYRMVRSKIKSAGYLQDDISLKRTAQLNDGIRF